MKKKTFKTTALCLAVLLLIAGSSCGGGDAVDESTDTVAATQAEQTETAEDVLAGAEPLPETDLGGMELRIANPDPDVLSWANILLDADEDGTPINDAIAKRNRMLEEQYHFSLQVEILPDFNTEYLYNAVMAGDDAYDLCQIYDVRLLYTLELIDAWDNIPYVQLDAPWWNPEASACFNINGSQIMTAGNMTLGYLSRSMCYLFNKTIYSSLGFDENLYELVLDGKWTQDVFFRMAADAVSDLNGDGAYDASDRYGTFGNPRAYYNTIFYGSGLSYVERGNDGLYEFTLHENEKTVSLFEKILSFDSSNPNRTYYNNRSDMHPSTLDPNTLFESGQALFHVQGLPHTIEGLRAMDDEFGIIPLPKADEAQKDYYTTAYGAAVTVLPRTVPEDRYEAIGLLTEAMTRYTYKEIVPIYKEVLLKTKYSRDNESSEMLDIVFSSIRFDPGILIWCNEIPDDICANIFMKGNNAVVSYLEKNLPVYQDKIDLFNEQMQ